MIILLREHDKKEYKGAKVELTPEVKKLIAGRYVPSRLMRISP